jgi:uncharacterized protein
MNKLLSQPCTAFAEGSLLSSGPLIEVALAVKNALECDAVRTILVFDDATGGVLDLDLRGTKADIIRRLSQSVAESAEQPKSRRASSPSTSNEGVVESRGRGRPKLGVIAREVTLLPRHWEWLNAQPGGASVALRKLVEEARRTGVDQQKLRATQEAAYQFMLAMAGNLPGFEEAVRALFAKDRQRFKQQTLRWPSDVCNYATALAFPGDQTDALVPNKDIAT